MLSEEVSRALESLGLVGKQAEVYLCLLGLGDASAYLVAKKTGLKRPTVYLILEELRKRGIVNLLPGAQAKRYEPKAPIDLLREAGERLQQAAEIVPSLQGMAKGGGEKIQAIYFEGFEGVEEAMRYGMTEMEGGELLAFWADIDETTERRFGRFREWHDQQRTLKISVRGFIPDGVIHEKYRKRDKDFGRVMRILPKDIYCPSTFCDIGPSFVRFFDPTHMQAIVIENPSVADALRQIFELVWRGGYGAGSH